MNLSADIVIIGSGIGGATAAFALAGTGARILVLERGERLVDTPETRDARAIFQQGVFRTRESWLDGRGQPFSPGNFYNVGGNSKFFGAIMYRYRAEDFSARRHMEGSTPDWPFGYDDLEPWYGAAEKLFRVRGELGDDPTEPPHSTGYDFPAVPDEPSLAIARERLRRQGIHASSLPIAVDHVAWLARARTPWDGFPDTFTGKIDAETGPLDAALKHGNVELLTGAEVLRLVTDPSGKRVMHALVRHRGEEIRVEGGRFIVASGAVNTAALLLRSAGGAHPTGLANGSDQVGRNFMNHNTTAVIGFDPRYRNDSIYQKTFGFNDYYLSDGAGGPPLGNVQLLGRVSGAILKANIRQAPEWALNRFARHSIDFLAMSEDLPSPESRVTVDGERITLQWVRSNWQAHLMLVDRLKKILRQAGFPLVLSRPFDRRTPSHQCGTVRMGNDPTTSPLDPYCRAYDHPNLFVVDASFLPTSAAVNPALTVAAQALRVADHIAAEELA